MEHQSGRLPTDPLGSSAVGSFIVQVNITYTLFVIFSIIFFIWMSFPRRHHADPGLWYKRMGLGAAVAVVMWLAPAYEQLRDGSRGNIYKLASYFVLGHRLPTLSPADAVHGAKLGFGDAGRLMSAEFRMAPPWLGGPTEPRGAVVVHATAPLVWLVVPVLLIAIGFVVARRGGQPTGRGRPGAHRLLVVRRVHLARLPRTSGPGFRLPLARESRRHARRRGVRCAPHLIEALARWPIPCALNLSLLGAIALSTLVSSQVVIDGNRDPRGGHR